MNKLALAAVALGLSSLAGSAPANDSLTSRAVTTLAAAVASQGDAALLQIQRELKESALEAMKPFLQKADKAVEPPQSGTAPAAQH